VWLEARRAARNRRTFVLRALVLVALLVVESVVVGWTTVASRGSSASGLADLGRLTFWIYSTTLLYLMGLMAPVLGAGAITEEREQQTAGLLLLTPVPPLGLLAGKFAGKLVLLELVLLAGLPVLALALALGGVDWREALAVAALLQVSLVAAATSGLYGAALHLSTPGAAIAAYLVLVSSWWLPAIPGRMIGSPMTAMAALLFSSARPGWDLLWPSLLTGGVTTAAGLIGAGVLFARFTEDASPPRARVRRLRWLIGGAGAAGLTAALSTGSLAVKNHLPAKLIGSSAFAAGLTLLCTLSSLALLTGLFLPAGRAAPDRATGASHRAPPVRARVWNNPVAWREWSLRGRARTVQWGVDILCLVAVLWAALASDQQRVTRTDLGAVGGIMHSLSYWWLMLLGAQSFVEERRARTLELLAAAPLSPARVLAGKMAGMVRRCLFPLGLSYALLALSGGPPLAVAQMMAQDLSIASIGLCASLWARSARLAYGTVLALVTLQSISTWLIRAGAPLEREMVLLGARLLIAAGALALACTRFRVWAGRSSSG
jgi:ABC-type transport system involved in multi-copper enzyme maturation permease subunit